MSTVDNPSQSGVPAGTFEGTAPVTPPATPATPVEAPQLGTPEPVAPVTPDLSTADTVTYDPTGDAGLDYALSYVGKLGYSDAHPAIQAAQNGDFTLIKAELATKGAVGADAVVALAEQAFARHQADIAAKATATTQAVYAAAGGEENWKTVQAWASANADPDEKAYYNAQFKAGGVAARTAAAYLTQLYNSKVGPAPKDPASPTRVGAETNAGSAREPLTAAAYGRAVLELQNKARGRDISQTPEYLSLQAQRLAARRAGH